MIDCNSEWGLLTQQVAAAPEILTMTSIQVGTQVASTKCQQRERCIVEPWPSPMVQLRTPAPIQYLIFFYINFDSKQRAARTLPFFPQGTLLFFFETIN